MTQTVVRVPFNRPTRVGDELEMMGLAVESGHIGGDGPYTQRCSKILEESVGCERALLTTSCTHALEMAALLLDVGPDDEVIVPSFTFVSSINAFVLRGARPVFADVDPNTLNIDATHVASLLTKRTRAIVIVHYAGVACDMRAIMDLAEAAEIPVIEDNAHGLYGTYQSRQLGTFGALATQSFHVTKNFTCGEGGALLINDPSLVERAEIIREKGTNRSRFFRGQVDKYTWVDVGSSYLCSDILAAHLWAQLNARREVQELRRALWERYRYELGEWAEARCIQLPTVPDDRQQAFHMFYLLMPNLEQRQAFISYLSDCGVTAVFHYQPLNISPMGLRLGGIPGACPVAESVADKLVRLPFYTQMTAAEQEHVITSVLGFTA
jgi:dTDP-4-amino-4,6-dideoxygalactose transaminase